jgi:hypothetical protein
MQPTYITIAQLFGSQTRHTVPLFQRPYVWNREEQWEPLWEDIAGLLERIEARQGEAVVASHFLGTIVLEQTPNVTGSLPRREVIDGQQRLTTLQIILKAAEHALATTEAGAGEADRTVIAIARRQIASLTENPAFAEEEERYKVWPTNEDRPLYKAVLDCSAQEGAGAIRNRMADAYRYFRETFEGYLTTDEPATRAQRFAAALKDYLKLIVLDLDPDDEPQAIFETLNAHGTPLLPADLMKNWLLWEATRQKLGLGTLYEDYWRPFDREHEYWRQKVGTGHAARARVDTFLQNWLTKEVMEPVSAKHLYDRFLRHIAALRGASMDGRVDIPRLMAGIRADADLYERIDKPGGSTRFDRFLQRLKVLDVIVFHPVLLALMGRPGSDAADLDAASVALESYLVRRMVCGYQTRGYGTLALRLLRVISETPADAPVAGVLNDHLRLTATGSEAWPDDVMFRSEWLRRKFYNGLRRDRVLMILQALEEAYQARAFKAEPLMTFDWSQLQIEHVMPQKWQQHWPLEGAGSPDEREWALQGIGNLTLVSGRLNPSLSNAPWTPGPTSSVGKREALRRHSRLELNRRLLDAHETWDEGRIRARAGELFEEARRIWPPCPPTDRPSEAEGTEG